MKFRKKPVAIEAKQWFKDGDHPAVSAMPKGDQFHYPHGSSVKMDDEVVGFIKTLEGEYTVRPGDWIITGVAGEHYPCKPEIFEATYEPVEG